MNHKDLPACPPPALGLTEVVFVSSHLNYSERTQIQPSKQAINFLVTEHHFEQKKESKITAHTHTHSCVQLKDGTDLLQSAKLPQTETPLTPYNDIVPLPGFGR